MKSFAEQLRDVRRNARLTQQQLAECIGVDRSIYAMYESGKLVPPPRLLEKICRRCAVTADVQRSLTAAAEE